MKKNILFISMLAVFALGIANPAIAGDGPAPNSDDHVPDGSGFNEGDDK
jgi:hypothetical protein